MINKKEFTKIAKGILRSQQGLQRPEPIHPTREWFIGILIAAVIFIASAFWSVQIYSTYQTTNAGAAGFQQVDVVVYRESIVSAALSDFSERQNRHNSLLDQIYTPDPVVEEVILEEGSASSSESVSTTTAEVVDKEAQDPFVAGDELSPGF